MNTRWREHVPTSNSDRSVRINCRHQHKIVLADHDEVLKYQSEHGFTMPPSPTEFYLLVTTYVLLASSLLLSQQAQSWQFGTNAAYALLFKEKSVRFGATTIGEPRCYIWLELTPQARIWLSHTVLFLNNQVKCGVPPLCQNYAYPSSILHKALQHIIQSYSQGTLGYIHIHFSC